LEKRLGTRALVEGALLAAAAVVLVLVGFYVPIPGAILTFFWPVPVILIQFRYGWKAGVLTVVVATLLLASFVGLMQAFTIALSLGSQGLLLGWAFKRKLNPFTTLLMAGIAIALNMVVSVVILRLFTGVDFIADLRHAFLQSQQMAQNWLGRLPSGAEQELVNPEQLTEMFVALLPTLVVVAALINALINFEVGRAVLTRLGYDIRPLPPFTEWELPMYTLYGYALGVSVNFLRPSIQWQGIEALSNNLIFFFSVLFLVQGLSLAYFLLRRAEISKGLSVFLLVIGIYMPMFAQMLTLAGMFELVFKFRRRLGKER
jgi:uncharacterized protein YybS (DUF2232 family)